MWKLHCFFVFLTILQVVLLQRPPPSCGPPPHEKPFECCKIPQLFSEESRSECTEFDEGKGLSKPDCSKLVCMFEKNKLMKDDNTVDKDAFAVFIDKWAEENSDFKDAVEVVKEVCLKDDLPAQQKVCEPGRIIGCAFFVTFDNCPAWEKNDKCDKVKEHLLQCKENFKG